MDSTFGILFDCDGTLIKSLDLGMDSYHYAFEKIGEPRRLSEEIKQYFGAGADRIFMKLLNDAEKARKAFEHYFEHESRQVSKILLHDGISDLLNELMQKNIPMGVVTGRHSQDLEMIFHHHDLHKTFKTLICDNHLENSKPHPEGILLGAKALGLAPEKIFYIGDSVMDMKAARRAGAIPIAALWDNWAHIEEMKREEPVLLAHHPSDIISFIYDNKSSS